MESRTHVLLQIPGRAQEAAQYLSALPTIVESVMTSGPYDVIATVSCAEDAWSRTLAKARRTPGLCALRLCRAG